MGFPFAEMERLECRPVGGGELRFEHGKFEKFMTHSSTDVRW